MPSDATTILLVDDEPNLRELLADELGVLGYGVLEADSGARALAALERGPVDLVISDIRMPGMNGIELCRRIKADARFALLPVILLSGLSDLDSRVAGLRAGADDLFGKPVSPVELQTRVAALLKVKALHDMNRRLYETVQAQAVELAEHRRTLEQRVQDQLRQLERLAELKRFLPPALADLIVAGGAEDPLRTHRADVTVVFVDLRGFTAFTETSEPEEVMTVLQEYHAVMGRVITEHEGTLERYAGDGIMIVLNDPLPVSDPSGRAIHMALAMRETQTALSRKWQRQGYDLNFGLGIAAGAATIGKIGFEDRWDYTAIGSVVNLAARLCGVARAGHVLVPEGLVHALEARLEAELAGEFDLKGFSRPVRAWNVLGLRA